MTHSKLLTPADILRERKRRLDDERYLRMSSLASHADERLEFRILRAVVHDNPAPEIQLRLLDPRDNREKIFFTRPGRLYRQLAFYCTQRGEYGPELPCLVGCHVENDPIRPGGPTLKLKERHK